MSIAGGTGDYSAFANAGETTGRYIALFEEGGVEAGVRALYDDAGIKAASAREIDLSSISSTSGGQLDGADAVVLEEIGVAVLNAAPDQLQQMSAAASRVSPIIALEPERVVYAASFAMDPGLFPAPPGVDQSTAFGVAPPVAAPAGPTPGLDYWRGYRDAVNAVVDRMSGTLLTETRLPELAPSADLSQATWGLHATRVAQTRFSGKGISVAVLDTGMDLTHPDFGDRVVTPYSFVPGEAVQDGNGHGTHCIGTACGPQRPTRLPRYGIAFDAQILVGKVLSNLGRGSDGGILAGINWAIAHQCQIISMSLGSPTFPSQPFSTVYEQVARRALARGTLIIAAAGNESNRPARINPVGHPANCPSILAVGAVDSTLQIARFSNAGINPNGGELNIVGPGVDVYSSWPAPLRYRSIQGTSMATPHVAGCAALYAEASGLRGRDLAMRVLQSARRLPLPVSDAGWGLVQAP